ncbi:MAG: leucine-rich repeat protein [Clostridia bacterium]|nr:leucine-rich repeat protein [Clostridia bacterium]
MSEGFEIEYGKRIKYRGTETEVTIPDSVTEIGMCVFEDCTSLTSVVIPDILTRIGSRAFENCASLKNCVLI